MPIIALDWDTLCINDHSHVISEYDEHSLIYSSPVDNSRFPLYAVCPNHLVLIDPSIVDLYIKYAIKQLTFLKRQNTLDGRPSNFTDMLPWSSVISYLDRSDRPPID